MLIIKELQFANTLPSTFSTFVGIVIVPNAEQFSKVPNLNSVNVLGRDIFDSDKQLKKALAPISFTVLGMFIFLSFIQSSKQLLSISTRLSGNLMLSKDEQPENVPLPIIVVYYQYLCF